MIGHVESDQAVREVASDAVWAKLGPDPVAVISAVREAYPELSRNGFGLVKSYGFDADKQAKSRDGMDDEHSIEEFLAAARFLTAAASHRLKRVSPNRTSYGWKHIAERWAGRYISNGMFICAAIALGWTVKPIAGSPNAHINLGKAALAFEHVKAA